MTDGRGADGRGTDGGRFRLRLDVVVSGAAVLLVAGALHAAAGPVASDPGAGTADGQVAAAPSGSGPQLTGPAGGQSVRFGQVALHAPTVPAGTSASAASALTAARRLPVKGRAPRTGYSRARFGPAWSDADRNGCDTRNDLLRRDLTHRVAKPGTNGCVTTSADLTDPYTGVVLHVRSGRTAVVDVDHVVSLSDAWQTGARAWTADRRLTFANDPLNLLVTSPAANRQKADSDAASWLPSRRSYRCAFAARQAAVKTKYHLWATAAERAALVRVLTTCPGLRAPSGGLPLTTAPPAPSGTVVGVVTPGAFCSAHGWYGWTKAHVRMRCTTSSTDTRYRWRRV